MRSRLRLAATAAFLASLVTTAALAENRTTIQITAVRASNEGRTFDPRLINLKSELKQLRMRSYSMVSTESRVLHGNGGQFGMELPNGRYLHITTREHTPDHLRLHILLNEDNRPVLNTYVKLELGSVLVVGGPRDESGTLVLTIGSRPWRDEDEDATDAKKPATLGSNAPADEGDAKPQGSARELPPMAPTPPTPAVSAVAPASPAH